MKKIFALSYSLLRPFFFILSSLLLKPGRLTKGVITSEQYFKIKTITSTVLLATLSLLASNKSLAQCDPGATEICNGIDDNCDSYVDQVFGNALSFDGLDDYVTVGNWWNYQTFTIELWVNPAPTQVEYADIIDNNHSGGVRWVCQREPAGGPNAWGFGIPASIQTGGVVFQLTPNTWQHLALVKDVNEVRVYINGTVAGSAPVAGTINGSGSGDDIWLGNWHGGGRNFNGKMDEIRLWNSVRTQTQIANYMSGHLTDPGVETSLVAYYPCNQGTANGDNAALTTLGDNSIYNHNGTLNNFTLNGTTSNWVDSPMPFSIEPIWYQDADGDGYGNSSVKTVACAAPSGYVADHTDCNDALAFAYPFATEVCNGIDDDCDAQVDESGNALHFDGVDDYVVVGNWWNYQTFTIELWVNPAATQKDYADIIDNNHSGGVRWVCQREPAGGPYAWQFGIPASISSTGPVVFQLTPNTWQHLALVKDLNEVRVYINGILSVSAPVSGTIIGSGSGDDIWIGNWHGGGRNFNGYMDEIRLWSSVRTQSQILDSMPSVLSDPTSLPDLVAYYNCDQGISNGNNSGITIAADGSSYNHNGTLTNFLLNGNSSNWVGSTPVSVSPIAWYADADGDGYGNPSVIIHTCSPPAGYVSNNLDCNDASDAVHPGAIDVCNGVDDDCDGSIDEDGDATFYRDNDGDGYGDANAATQACSAPDGYVVNNSDCNDNDVNVHPEATEVCNGIDDDCDGSIDEGVSTTFYRDNDDDGYGDLNLTIRGCSPPMGYVSNNTDCNDANNAAHPGATEICGNGIDDNCNGEVDEGCNSCSLSVNAGMDEDLYFGYPLDQCVTKTATVTSGTGPFTYEWTLDRALLLGESISGANTASVTLCLLDTAQLCLAVTDTHDCTATDCAMIFAEDVRCFAGKSQVQKVKVCHLGTTICVDSSAVAAHLAHGDYLGKCTNVSKARGVSLENSKTDLRIFPNPANKNFSVEVVSPDNMNNRIIRIINMSGQVVKEINMKQQTKQNISIEIAGVYSVQLISGKETITKKLVVVH